jgi:hypothetical protein
MSDTPPQEPEAADGGDPEIVTGPAQVDPTVDADNPSGLGHGRIVQNLEGAWERIVHVLDETGRAVWHKEPLADETGAPAPTAPAAVKPVADPAEAAAPEPEAAPATDPAGS